MLLLCVGFGFFSTISVADCVFRINVPVFHQSVIASLDKKDARNKS